MEINYCSSTNISDFYENPKVMPNSPESSRFAKLFEERETSHWSSENNLNQKFDIDSPLKCLMEYLPNSVVRKRLDSFCYEGQELQLGRTLTFVQKDSRHVRSFAEVEGQRSYQDSPRKKPLERAGDWYCIFCNNLNFSFRDICNRCNAEKAKQTG